MTLAHISQAEMLEEDGMLLYAEDRPSSEEPETTDDESDAVGSLASSLRGRYARVAELQDPRQIVELNGRTTCEQFCEMIGCPSGKNELIDGDSSAAYCMGLLVKHGDEPLRHVMGLYSELMQIGDRLAEQGICVRIIWKTQNWQRETGRQKVDLDVMTCAAFKALIGGFDYGEDRDYERFGRNCVLELTYLLVDDDATLASAMRTAGIDMRFMQLSFPAFDFSYKGTDLEYSEMCS